MRLIPVALAAFAAVSLAACTYVERERTPAVVQTPPAAVVTPVPVAPAPTTVTVRPAY